MSQYFTCISNLPNFGRLCVFCVWETDLDCLCVSVCVCVGVVSFQQYNTSSTVWLRCRPKLNIRFYSENFFGVLSCWLLLIPFMYLYDTYTLKKCKNWKSNQGLEFLNQQITCKYLKILLIIKLKLIITTVPVLFIITYTSVNWYTNNSNHLEADTVPKLQELN